eukprot:8114184-Lingulodinium_polyedra.AAC.1
MPLRRARRACATVCGRSVNSSRPRWACFRRPKRQSDLCISSSETPMANIKSKSIAVQKKKNHTLQNVEQIAVLQDEVAKPQ